MKLKSVKILLKLKTKPTFPPGGFQEWSEDLMRRLELNRKNRKQAQKKRLV